MKYCRRNISRLYEHKNYVAPYEEIWPGENVYQPAKDKNIPLKPRLIFHLYRHQNLKHYSIHTTIQTCITIPPIQIDTKSYNTILLQSSCTNSHYYPSYSANQTNSRKISKGTSINKQVFA